MITAAGPSLASSQTAILNAQGAPGRTHLELSGLLDRCEDLVDQIQVLCCLGRNTVSQLVHDIYHHRRASLQQVERHQVVMYAIAVVHP